jgi:hypothetical protein
MDARTATGMAAIEELVKRVTGRLCTAMPGVIVSFDSTTCLCSVQPAIRMKQVINQKVTWIDLPVVEHVPICLPHSATGGVYLTVPILPGDPCLIIFSQRGIDQFVQAGGIQNPPDGTAPAYTENRHHDLTDAICIPNLMPAPNAIPDWSATALELRSKDGTTKVSVQVGEITLLVAGTEMVLSSSGVQITGNVSVTGTITATGEITGGTTQIPLSTHIHGDVMNGGGVTGGPQA